MKRYHFKTLFVIAVLAALVSVFAVTAYADDRTVTAAGTCGAEGDNLTWTLYSDGELVISGIGEMMNWTSSSTLPWDYWYRDIRSVIIENGITSIGNYAFANSWNLTSVKIPEGVTSIGDYAFYSCYDLTSIDFPDGVTSIGDYALCLCENLVNIDIPASVTSIGNSAFANCDLLAAIDVADGNSVYIDIGGVLFTVDMTTIVTYPAGKTKTSFKIPVGVTNIGDYAFYGCTSLTSIKIPEGVTSIGSYAFSYCSNLTSIDIPEGVTSIGGSAFAWCSNITSLVIPEGVKCISDDAFSYCFNLTSIEIPEGVTSIGRFAFFYCSKLTSIEIPTSVMYISSNAFAFCGSLGSVTFYSGFATLGSEVFNCTSSDFVIYGGENSTAQRYATANFHNFEVIEIPDIIVDSGDCGDGGDNVKWVFYNSGELVISGMGAMKNYSSTSTLKAPWYTYRSGITTLTVNFGVTSIGRYSFTDCSEIISVSLPQSLSSIESCSFSKCSGLVAINIPNSVTTIGSSAFASCTKLAYINIPNSVTSIGGSAFSGCSEITSMIVPNSVTSIGSGAFFACSGLRSITLPFIGSSVSNLYASSSTLFGYIFGTNSYTGGVHTTQKYSSSYSSTHYIPASLTSVIVTGGRVFYGAFSNCNYLESITLGSDITEIGEYAFDNCAALNEVSFNEGLEKIGDYAFQHCSLLKTVSFPNPTTSIGEYAFKNVAADFVIYGYADSTAEAFASKNGYSFVELLPFIASGSCGANGDNLTWVLCDNGELIISGSGAMANWTRSSTAPWYSNRSSVTKVIIENGVTSIGDYAFSRCTPLQNVTIPDSVTSIGDLAFNGCVSLRSITLPKDLTEIGDEAFGCCSSLKNATVLSRIAEYGWSVFEGTAVDFVLSGYAGSTSETYANENDHAFKLLTSSEIKFLSASLSLYNDIAVNFKANKAAMDAAGYTAPYAVFEFGGNTYTVTDYTVETMLVSGVETDVYVFPFKNLAPDRMNDTITATLHAAFNGEDYASNSVSYSVAKYCYNQLKKCTQKTALATVCVDLLNYGSATQEYTGYRTDALANANLTDAQKSWGTQDTREFKNVTVRVDAPAVETAKWKSAALKLRENITVEMKFEAADIAGLYVEVEMYGRTYRIDEFGYDETYGWYVVEFDKSSATHMSETIKATVRDADGNAVSKVLTYSVESYAASKQGMDALGELVKAMMKYGDAAIAYAKSLN